MKFPVIYFDKSFRHLELMKGRELFSITNKLALKKGLLLKSKVIDCEGVLFEVVSIKKLGNTNPIWKFEFFNPMIKVQMFTERKGEMELKKLKSKILSVFKSDIDFWDSDGELNKKISFIETATSHKEVIEYLTENLYGKDK